MNETWIAVLIAVATLIFAYRIDHPKLKKKKDFILIVCTVTATFAGVYFATALNRKESEDEIKKSAEKYLTAERLTLEYYNQNGFELWNQLIQSNPGINAFSLYKKGKKTIPLLISSLTSDPNIVENITNITFLQLLFNENNLNTSLSFLERDSMSNADFKINLENIHFYLDNFSQTLLWELNYDSSIMTLDDLKDSVHLRYKQFQEGVYEKYKADSTKAANAAKAAKGTQP